MKIKEQSKDGIIYQLEMAFEEIGTALVDITYSGYTDASENSVLEFEWACASETDNTNLSEADIDRVNKILECGQEERIVRFLIDQYEKTDVRFDVGEYDWIIENM
ncbi:hypothetical protein UFOVP723_95 [uncultured Caudovirales phage]|uniref:Uncharacterized protein n=1 Tax=uncultured Caudovirales phage TaxID=2100421 RepID=A0A6J5NLC8_9CAUD|nr:hypothetical protein UFOVP723_95 [uncultured Caudovirales phage]